MWAIAISAFAAAGTVANFVYTQWATNRREVAKWRREELQKLVGRLLQLSRDRQSDLDEAYEAYEFHQRRDFEARATGQHIAEMELIVEQIQLLDDRLAVSARSLWEAHAQARREYANSEPQDPMSEIEMLSVAGLDDLHRAVIEAFRRTAKIKVRV